MTQGEIKSNIESVSERIARAACAFGRPITLVAATKTVPPPLIDFALSCGIKHIGENRVQEYLAKRDSVQGASWHFIGTLQTNKAKYIVGSVALIQSVNSANLAREIDRLAKLRGTVQDVLIEVNAGGEPSKTGASIYDAEWLIDLAASLPGISVRGLMAVPPKDCGDEVYKRLYELYERTKTNISGFDILSVGMSADYERAIAFGSNMVRLGTAIFGSRQ